MHTYSTDNDNRPFVYGFIGIVSYFAVLGLGWFTKILSAALPVVAGLTISWGLGFTALSTAFSQYGWQTSFARTIGACKVPDFNGEWSGYMKTSYEGSIPDQALHETNDPAADMQGVAATLRIKQTWRKISIHLETRNSKSDSTGATVLTEDGQWPSLSYQYENDPDPDSKSSMTRHYGTADLALKTIGDGDVLEGFYYTGPGRENYGEMYFERVE